MIRRLMMIIMIFIMIIPTTGQNQLEEGDYYAQFEDMDRTDVIEHVWNDVKDLNSEAFADLDLVYPGDVVETPLGMRVVQPTKPPGGDHLWQIATSLTDDYIMPYFESGMTAEAEEPEKEEYSFLPWWVWVLVALIVISILTRHTWLRNIIGRLGSRVYTNDEGPAFVENPPDFKTVHKSEAQRVTQEALDKYYGPGFKIIEIETVKIKSGKGKIFYADGSHRTVHFNNDDGFRVKIRFDDGHEETVYCKQSCCNIFWSSTRSVFDVVVVSDNGKSEKVPRISKKEITAIEDRIKRLSTTKDDSDEKSNTDTKSNEAKTTLDSTATTDQPTQSDPAPASKISEFQFSDKDGFRMTMKGDIEFNDLIKAIQEVKKK